MAFSVSYDLNHILTHVVAALRPFAEVNEVDLQLSADTEVHEFDLDPEHVLRDLSRLLSRILAFTPQQQRVLVSIDQANSAIVIENSGVNLGAVGELRQGYAFPILVENTTHGGSRFNYLFAVTPESALAKECNSHQTLIKPWYAEIRKRLTTHFSVANRHPQNSRANIFVKKVDRIIESNLDAVQFGPESLARMMALSKSQLFRKMKSLTGLAPGQYLRRARLEKAKILLTKQDVNVTEVAYEVGFNSVSHFSRAFLHEFGVNPSQLRKGGVRLSVDETGEQKIATESQETD